MDTLLNCVGNVHPEVRNVVSDLIDSGTLGSAVYRWETDSTNSDALEELQASAFADQSLPRLTLTDRQRAGRGRQGNRWVSDDASLTFSLTVKLDFSMPAADLLSPAVGVAASRAIEYLLAPNRLVLKWPNDLCCWRPDVKNRGPKELNKLGGILIESVAAVPDHCVIGIGVNLNQKPSLTEREGMPAACLAELPGRTVPRAELLAALTESLVETLAELEDSPRGILAAYRERCGLSGQSLTLKRNGQMVEGNCVGIADDGSLEMIVDGAIQRFRSGEVCSVRPQ